ncbi:unnamed protein product, partial [Urochloa humidicola]
GPPRGPPPRWRAAGCRRRADGPSEAPEKFGKESEEERRGSGGVSIYIAISFPGWSSHRDVRASDVQSDGLRRRLRGSLTQAAAARNRGKASRPRRQMAATAPAPDAMQQFPEGAHVRLRICVHGGYLHTNEDGVRVSLRRRGSVGAASRVERVLHDGATCVLLHSAAYGRYLAAPGPAGPPRPPRRPGRARHGPHPVEARRSGHTGYILLRHVSYHLLRANGRYHL